MKRTAGGERKREETEGHSPSTYSCTEHESISIIGDDCITLADRTAEVATEVVIVSSW